MLGLALLIAVLLAACGGSPKARADELAKLLPAETASWERNDRQTARLLGSTVMGMGQVIMTYEGADDALAYIVIAAHPSLDAAEVAATNRERELRLDGLELERDRAPGLATATVAQSERVRYALFQEDTYVVEIDAIAANGEAPISDQALDELLDVVRAALDKVLDQ